MSYGMSYEQFWFGDPWMAKAYEQAYLLKRRVDNEIAWIHGAYVHNAVSAALASAFGKRKVNYIEKPVDFFPKTDAELAEEKRQKKLQLIRFLSTLKSGKKKDTGVDPSGKP